MVGVWFRLKSITNRWKSNGETFIKCLIALNVMPSKNWCTNPRTKNELKQKYKIKIPIANSEFGCANNNNNLSGDLRHSGRCSIREMWNERVDKRKKRDEMKPSVEIGIIAFMQIMMRICDIVSSPASVPFVSWIIIFLYCIAVGFWCAYSKYN